MMLTWMAYAALCAGLIALAASCIDGIVASMRRARRNVWIVAIAASTIVPLALPFRPHRPVTEPRPSTNTAAPVGAVASTAPSNRIDVIVFSIWAAASAGFALVLLTAHRRTTAALRQCRRATVAGSQAFVSSDFGPAVVGVLRRHIVVPAWTLALSDDEQRLVVAHELEHARSGDPLLALAGLSAVVAMPWNPALWWQLARLRLAIELDCDARVVARTSSDTLSYSRLLVSVGERALATRQPVLAMSRSRSALAKRFDALLGKNTLRPRRALGLSLLAAGTIASVAFVPSPDMADIVEAMRVYRATAVAPPAAPAQSPIGHATFTPTPTNQTFVGAVQRRAGRATAKPQNRPTRLGDVRSLPPVSVVPSTLRGPLDSVVVAKAVLPPSPPTFGVIRAVSGGARAGFAGVATPLGSDSSRVTRGGRGGGRAVLVPRPDTTRPPR